MSHYILQAFDNNVVLMVALQEIAQKKNVTPSQLSIAWVSSLGHHVIPLPGASYVYSLPPRPIRLTHFSNVNQTLENLGGGDVVLDENDLKEIGAVMERIEIIGARYPSFVPTWG